MEQEGKIEPGPQAFRRRAPSGFVERPESTAKWSMCARRNWCTKCNSSRSPSVISKPSLAGMGGYSHASGGFVGSTIGAGSVKVTTRRREVRVSRPAETGSTQDAYDRDDQNAMEALLRRDVSG